MIISRRPLLRTALRMSRAASSGGPAVVAVVGAGFSGTMAAIQLRRRLPPSQEIVLIERGGEFGRGIAFADTKVAHLLNVRAANMSALADDPGHFERWVAINEAFWPAEVHRTAAGLFTSRKLYGTYLQETLDAEVAASGGSVRLLHDDICSMSAAPPPGPASGAAAASSAPGWLLQCKGGKPIPAAAVVLATGHLPAERPCDGLEFRDPWAPAALSGLDATAPVLIVGTGLTMVDIVLGLQARAFTGPIIALSRRGLLPHAHKAAGAAWPTPAFSAAERGSALALLRAVRAQLAAAAAQGVGWRAVIDSLRPVTAALWGGLPAEERARFMRHVGPYWDVRRHRIAPPAADAFDALRAAGGLRIVRGRLRAVQPASCGTGLATAVFCDSDRPAGAEEEEECVPVQRVIYATGLRGAARAGGGLVASLLAGGQARLDSQELGLDVEPAGLRVLDAAGQPHPRLWALGPLVRGVFWECIAVPDIRVQAALLGREVAAALRGPPGAGTTPS